MKKQILVYRREIIELSSNKKHHQRHHKSEGRRVPRLDLSKLHRDSEDPNYDDGDDLDEENNSCVSLDQQ